MVSEVCGGQWGLWCLVNYMVVSVVYGGLWGFREVIGG